jgi:hypothetical protein
VVRLYTTGRHERIGAGFDGLRNDQLELSHLVAAESEWNGVVALHEKARTTAERRAKPLHLLDRGRRGEKRRRRKGTKTLDCLASVASGPNGGGHPGCSEALAG